MPASRAGSAPVGGVLYPRREMGLGLSTLNHSTMFGHQTALADQVRAAADAGFDLVALDIFSLRATIADGGLDALAAHIDDVGVDGSEILRD